MLGKMWALPDYPRSQKTTSRPNFGLLVLFEKGAPLGREQKVIKRNDLYISA